LLQQQDIPLAGPVGFSKANQIASEQPDYRPGAIADAITEHPDGAVCLYERH